MTGPPTTPKPPGADREIAADGIAPGHPAA
jgi:hypothetical protein